MQWQRLVYNLAEKLQIPTSLKASTNKTPKSSYETVILDSVSRSKWGKGPLDDHNQMWG